MGKHSLLQASTKQSNMCVKRYVRVHCSTGVVAHKAQTEIAVTREQSFKQNFFNLICAIFCILYANTLKKLTRSSLNSNVFLPVAEKMANLTQTKAKP